MILLLKSRVDDPIMALSGIILGTFLLAERFAEAQVVSDAVPKRPGLSGIERRESATGRGPRGEASIGSTQDGHSD